MNQIEKVARALCDDAGCVWDHDPQSLSRIEWHKAACAAIAAMPVQAEPVAWRYERTDGFVILVSKRYTDQHPKGDGWTETPLYAHPPAPQWQGIESAPMDGTSVLLLIDGLAIEGAYDDKTTPDGYEYGEGAWDLVRLPSHGCGCCSIDNPEPTHWMPIPTPPAGGSDAE